MQPETHPPTPHGSTNGYNPTHAHGRQDATSFSPPTPGLTTALHRHHQPARPMTEAEAAPSLRRRHTSQSTSDRLVVAIVTPFSDTDRRKEHRVATPTKVSELKDIIARGDEGEKWERTGMRLVWQGRIVRDEEELGLIVGKREPASVHTFHLVARRLNIASGPSVLPAAADVEPASDLSASETSTGAPSRDAQALADSAHYLLFTARHHLCLLLNTAPLAWSDTVPPPVIDQQAAREAVMSVVGAVASDRADGEEGWEDWDAAFADATGSGWDESRRLSAEREVKTLWSASTGTNWKEGQEGEVTTIEVECVHPSLSGSVLTFSGFPYQLHLPPLHLMTAIQVSHLLQYLRITNLLPLLNAMLERLRHQEQRPTPTPTIPEIVARAEALIARPPQFGLQVRLTPANLGHIAFNAIKITGMVWMLTRALKWNDTRFWLISGGLFGWWLMDAVTTLNPGLIWNTRRNPGVPGAPNANAGAQAGVDAPGNPQAGPAAAGVARAPARPGPSTPYTLLTQSIPLVHLDTDSEQLHISPRRPYSQPLRVVTQLLLPVALWFVTLIPEWQFHRARMIRQREREIRTRVEQLTSASAEITGATEVSEGQEGQAQSTERPPVFPPGLLPAAQRYYERVMSRGDEIDWEEEREAQRAMGVED